MLQLPHDVWLHIAQFIPALMLQDLLSVNSTFFNIAMDCRYRRMSFAFLDNKMLRNLIRLRDPVVAKRVRVLHVHPGFLNQVLKIEEEPYDRPSLCLKLTTLAHQILKGELIQHNKFRLAVTFRTAADVVRVMLEVFSSLPNVTDYHIMWCGLQTVPRSPVPLLAAVFRSSLRKLSLEISLENVESLFTPATAISNLEELDLVLRVDHHRVASSHNLTLIKHLAPAISRLRLSLQKLAIQTWEPLDLSSLFRSIQYLPILNHLALAIPVEAPHLGDPYGLTDFLNRQRTTLRSLSLRATQYSGVGMTPDPNLIDGWIKKALAGINGMNLRKLDISSSLFPLETSIYCLQKFSATITSLGLTGCYHRYADVAMIVKQFASRPQDERLVTLHLGSVTLTPQLVDLLAKELPNLYRLELLVREVMSHANTTHRKYYRKEIDNFFSEMETRTYTNWRLRYMNILLTSSPYRLRCSSHLGQLFAMCVPTIQGFT